MISSIHKRIERRMTLIHHLSTDEWTVETHRPLGRHWAWHIYTPTAASLKRVKNIVGYKCGPNGWSFGGKRGTTVEYNVTR